MEELRGRDYLIHNETAKRNQSVYVIELREEVRQVIKRALRGDDDKPCVYVGMTGKTLEERLSDHRRGHKDGKGYVKKYGIDFLAEHTEGPYSPDVALTREAELAEELRKKGWTVLGGH